MSATISVVLNTYNRLQHIHEQIASVTHQTVQPMEIIIWNNSDQQLLINPADKPAVPITVFNSTSNTGVWSRFFAGFNCKGDYIAFFDDDTIPGNRWFENCLNCPPGLIGTTGYRFSYDSYFKSERVGWLTGNNELVEVDLIGHAWFFKRCWLQHFVNELPDLTKFPGLGFGLCGEDLHLSYTLKKYGGIRSFVAPQPTTPTPEQLQQYGSTKGVLYGTDEAALSLTAGMDNRFEEVYRQWVILKAHPLVLYQEVVENEMYPLPYRLQWSHIYRLMQQRTPFCFIRFGETEVKLIGLNENQLGTELLAISAAVPDPDVYYGVLTTTDLDRLLFLFDMFKPCTHTLKNLYSNSLFSDANYRYTEEFIISGLHRGVFGKVVLICQEECKLYVPHWVAKTLFVGNDVVRFWEENSDTCQTAAIELAHAFSNTVFLFTVGPLSKVLAHLMWRVNRNNCYVDIGSALDPILKGRITKGYQMRNSVDYDTSDKLLKFGDTGLEILAHL